MILTTGRLVCLKLSVVKGQRCHVPRTSRAEMGSCVHSTSSLHKLLALRFNNTYMSFQCLIDTVLD